MKPLAIDLFTGLHGFGEAAAAEGYRVVGFDLHDMCERTGHPRIPGVRLVLQDVLTIHGSQFRGADLIWASPPCQQYSWLAMPWSRSRVSVCAKCGGRGWSKKTNWTCRSCKGVGKVDNSQVAKALRKKWETEGPDNRLFEACFRIQREASEAAGHHIPMVVENVRGAQEWLGAVFYGLEVWMKANREERWRMGRSAWNFGSFHLWGDVPALMPMNRKMNKSGVGGSWFRERNGKPQPGIRHEDRGGIKGLKTDRDTLENGTGGSSWFFGGKRADPRDVRRDDNGEYKLPDGTKIGGDWFSDPNSTCRKHGSRSSARKAASALIARIPFELASHIARVYKPQERAA